MSILLLIVTGCSSGSKPKSTKLSLDYGMVTETEWNDASQKKRIDEVKKYLKSSGYKIEPSALVLRIDGELRKKDGAGIVFLPLICEELDFQQEVKNFQSITLGRTQDQVYKMMGEPTWKESLVKEGYKEEIWVYIYGAEKEVTEDKESEESINVGWSDSTPKISITFRDSAVIELYQKNAEMYLTQ